MGELGALRGPRELGTWVVAGAVMGGLGGLGGLRGLGTWVRGGAVPGGCFRRLFDRMVGFRAVCLRFVFA